MKGAKEPNNLFDGAIDESRLRDFWDSKHSIRPDFYFHILKRHDDVLPSQLIYDVKNIFNFARHYTHSDRLSAVNRLERDIKLDYIMRARMLDVEFNGTAIGLRGPIEQRLDALGNVIPLCFGRFGEINQSVIDLLSACSLMKARRVASTNQTYGGGLGFSRGVDVEYWRTRFMDTYRRVLATSVGYFKASVIINRKGLIGMQSEKQKEILGTSGGRHPSIVELFAGFKRDHFGPNKGTHQF